MSKQHQWDHQGRSLAKGSPFAGTGNGKHCMTCNQWRDTLGGTIDKRTRLFKCAGCSRPALPKEAAHA